MKRARSARNSPSEVAKACGILYVIGGPIGNLEDITLRALRVLGEVDLVLAEDTRVTRKLLGRYDIRTPVASCHAYTTASQLAALALQLAEGKRFALVTDAGTPGISDPGDRMVSAALHAGAAVTPIPGPSAVTAVVSISAVPGGRFLFGGFPPRGRSDRAEFFRGLKTVRHAIVLFESPRRILQTLEDLGNVLGDRSVLIGRELTKRFEAVYRGPIGQALLWCGPVPRGEFAIVVYPPAEADAQAAQPAESVDQLLLRLLATGISPSEAVKSAARATKTPRRQVYARLLELRHKDFRSDGMG